MKNKKTLLNLILPLITVMCLFAVWAIVSSIVGSEYILPSVWVTIRSAFALFGKANFYLALLYTFIRVIIAFVISFTLAFILAFFSTKNQYVRRIVSPIISIIRALPTIAIVLLLLFWTNSNVAPVVVTMLVVLPTTYTGLKNALEEVDGELKEMCQVFGVDKKQVFFKVQLPAIMPSTCALIGSGISLNLKLMVAAEVLSATVRSIGNLLNYASYNGEMASMMALVLVTVILGFIIESVFNLISKKVGAWK